MTFWFHFNSTLRLLYVYIFGRIELGFHSDYKQRGVKTKHNEMSVCFNREPCEG
jgi:hypothetical protein